MNTAHDKPIGPRSESYAVRGEARAKRRDMRCRPDESAILASDPGAARAPFPFIDCPPETLPV